MKNRLILIVDAIINFALGVLLLLTIPFSDQIANFLGVPKIEHAFYPSLFGSVLVGIGIALLIEGFRERPQQMVGLGLGGAIAINLCGGILLTGWLLLGNLQLPLRGQIFLWVIAVVLVLVSSVEWMVYQRRS
jgi:hypothetical protein